MKEDRSWVLPLSFATFCGILIAVIFSVLAQQELLLSDRASVLIGWLTLLVTTAGFGITIFVVMMTARQMADTSKQTDLQDLEVFSDRMERIDTVLSLTDEPTNIASRYSGRPVYGDNKDRFGATRLADHNYMRQQYVKITKAVGEDIFNDTMYTDKLYGKFIDEYVNVVFTLERTAKSNNEENVKKFIVEKKEDFENFAIKAREYRMLLHNRKRALQKARKSITKKHY
jgi:hypothetical protein